MPHSHLARTVRRNLRIFRSQPGVAVSAVVALAMGIGFTTTMFGIVHGATRSLPVESPDRIAVVDRIVDVQFGQQIATRPSDVAAWQQGATSFEQIAAFETYTVNLSDGADAPERAAAAEITANAFAILGARPQAGRALGAADERPGAPAVVVVSDELWRRRYGGTQTLIGSTIRLNGQPHTVVGIMSPGFAFPIRQALWLPLSISTRAAAGDAPALRAFGRLRPAATMAAAGAEVTALSRNASTSAGTTFARATVYPFVEMETPREVVRALYLLILAVSFVLVIACSNVANLLLARAAVRQRDTAVHLALGAERRHLVTAHLAEAALLAGLATIIGLGMAWAGMRVFAVNTASIIEAYWVDIRLDPVVAIFAAALAFGATLAAGLLPALRASRASVSALLGGSGRTTMKIGRLGRSVVAIQVTLACGLLAFTMVLGRGAATLRALDWPFAPEQILTAELGDIDDRAGTRLETLTRLVNRVSAAPGVSAAALISALPGRGGGRWTFGLDAPVSGSVPAGTTAVAAVTPGFLDVLGVRADRGRGFRASDDARAPRVAIVNRSFVERHAAGRDPLGRQIYLGSRAFTIVGVVADLMAADMEDRDQQGVYVPIAQMPPLSMRLMARGPSDPMSLAAPMRAAVAAVDPDLPLTEVFTLHEAAYRDKRVLDVLSLLFLLFGAGALLLTGIGLYSVLSFAVATRSREISIRLALGATRSRVVRLVARQALRQVTIGLAIGCALALLLSIAFAAAVEQMTPAGWPLLVAIAGAVSVTCAAALIVPATRAARTAIVSGLRAD